MSFDDCGALTGAVGVVGTVGHPDAQIARLDSASVEGIEVPIDVPTSYTGGVITAMVDLDWTADGPVHRLNFSDEHGWSHHRTRAAEVSGSVAIELNGQPWATFDADDLVVLGLPEIVPQITYYNEMYQP